MKKIKNLKLTDDPLTNIHIMIPLLGEREKEAVSYLMYGCVLGEQMAKKEIADDSRELHEA